MQQPTRRKMIALDNDRTVLAEIRAVASAHFDVVVTTDVRRALTELQAANNLSVFITEQVIDSTDGISLLEQVRNNHPQARRVMLTAYSDLSAIVNGLHSGAVQHLLSKPIDRRELLAAMGSGADTGVATRRSA